MRSVQQELPLLTPDKTILYLRLAGLGNRVAAHLIDLLIFAFLMLILSIFLTIVGPLFGTTIAYLMAFLPVVVSLGPFAYFILFEGLWNGQTPGKRLFNLRVRMADGTPVTFAAALGRNLLRPADMLPGPYLVGVTAIFLNPRSQRVGDLVANTIVVLDQRRDTRYQTAPHKVGIHPLEHEVGDLRGMTREEYETLRRFCDRYPQLTATTQERLLRETWAPLAERRQVPALPNVHPIYLAEATVMKYGRQHGLL
jgi:uncharacterized RDD family membrane protein YckC